VNAFTLFMKPFTFYVKGSVLHFRRFEIVCVGERRRRRLLYGMVGVRETKKADSNRRILEAAAKFFLEVGYDSARIEDIADSANIAVGTFYNYYKNKGDILLAMVSMEVEEVLAAGREIVEDPPLSVELALNTLIHRYFDLSLVYFNKEMWRTAMAISIQRPETPFSQRYTELDKRISKQISTLIRCLQMRGAVRPEIDVEAVGEMIFNNLNMMFTEFARDDSISVEELKRRVIWQQSPLATLISSQHKSKHNRTELKAPDRSAPAKRAPRRTP
jgi:AcrR family transcriptional regulator